MFRVMREFAFEVEPGRTVGVADFGPDDGTALIWCHGGPGSRLEPTYVAARAGTDGWRAIGIDRPGYGNSDPQPGRTIAGWVGDALAVAGYLGVGTFYAIGLSTGGAYALALAALAPQQVLGVLACCAMTDMRNEEARSTMSRPHALAVWDAPDRDAAIVAAVESHGIDGSKIVSSNEGPPLAASDRAMLMAPWGRAWMESVPAMFAHGLEGYADDRIADRDGWTDFDVADVCCPVVVLHGTADVITLSVHARHTASIVPGARLKLLDELGHFSIEDEIVPTLRELRDSSERRTGPQPGTGSPGEVIAPT